MSTCVPVPATILPTYPFQRQRYWTAPRPREAIGGGTGGHPLLGRQLRTPSLHDTVFETSLSTRSHPLLAEHRIYGHVVVPGAHHVAMLHAATAATAGVAAGTTEPTVLRELVFAQPLTLPGSGERVVQVVLSGDRTTARLVGPDGDGWTEYATALLAPAPEPGERPASAERPEPGERPESAEWPEEQPLDVDAIRARCTRTFEDLDGFYQQIDAAGLHLGPSFRWYGSMQCGDGEAIGAVRAPDGLDPDGMYPIHPGLLDACFQLLGLAQPPAGGELPIHVPVTIERLRIRHRPATQPGTRLWAHARTRRLDGTASGTVAGDVRIVDGSGASVIEVEGLRLKQVDPTVLRLGPAAADDLLYEVAWRPARLDDDPAPPGGSGEWLVFADEGGFGQRVASLLEAEGNTCTLVRRGATGNGEPAGCVVDPDDRDGFLRLLDPPAAGDRRGIVFLWPLDFRWPLDAPADPDAELSSLHLAQQAVTQSVLHLVQSLVARSTPARLYLVTRGAQAVGEPTRPLALAQAPVWGLASTIALEHPDLHCTRIDLDPAAVQPEPGGGDQHLPGASGGEKGEEKGENGEEGDEAALLVSELRRNSPEDRVALRGGERHVARLARGAGDSAGDLAVPAGAESFRLEVATPGTLERLVLRPAARRAPAANEVEIRVRATGLNFRDVLNALGLYPGDAGPLGVECVGEIIAVGSAVRELRVGDRVAALVPAAFSRCVTVDAALVAALPAVLSDAAGATVPVAFLTAYHGLVGVGRLQPAERVLIHAAAGGVGMAAVQIAQALGADVYATASPAKWPVLRQMGVEHVYSSRTLDFAREIRDRTGGAGVDVVLNSLTGEYITESLKLLANRGRFVEIGKREIWPAERAAEVRDDITYTAFDLVELARDEPATVHALLQSLMQQFATGSLRPLPHRVFPLAQAVPAFRYMAQARHTGKVVVSHDETAANEVVRRDGAYLITGGLGGLGLHVARWLAERGAHSLVLVGRAGVTTDNRAALDALRELGAQVTVVRADIAQPGEVAELMRQVAAMPAALRGVVHAAGVLSDGILSQQEWTRFVGVLGPKLGAWNLHRATRELDLDFFVLFSSVAAVLGSPGQGSYAAGNAFLDLLAAERRRLGLPGLSIGWGPWRGAGMAASVGDRGDRRWASRGMGLIEPEQGLALLERALALPAAQVGIFATDWAAYLRPYPSGQPPLLRELARSVRPAAGGTGVPHVERRILVERLETAAGADRQEVILGHVRELAARVLGVQAAHTLDTGQPLSELGFDSLMAVELRNALSLSIDRGLPASLLFDYPTIEALAAFVAQELGPAQPPAEPAVAQPTDPRSPAAQSADPQPTDPRSPAAQSADPQPADPRSPAAQPTDPRPAASRPHAGGGTARDAWVAQVERMSDAEVEALLDQELSRPRRKGPHE